MSTDRKGPPVIRIDIPWVISVVAALDKLDSVFVGQNQAEAWYYLFDAQNQLEKVFDQSIYRPFLRISRQAAFDLHGHVKVLVTEMGDNAQRTLTDVEVWSLKNYRDRFKTVFFAEISSIPAYLVTAKEGYDVDILINAGRVLFPPTLLAKAPETEKDAMEAGKALAFEVATGCGFHVFRVTESVVRRYWDEVSGNKKRPEPETLGKFASEMEQGKFGDPKIIESIKSMTKHHRNPLIHPEVILSVEDAIGIVGIARSVVGAMLSVLPDVPLTTGAPLAITP